MHAYSLQLAVIVALAGCGRIGFDPATGESAACQDPADAGDTLATATPARLGDFIDGVMCPGDPDVFAVTLNAGDEVAVEISTSKPGFPAIELVDGDDAPRAVRTFGQELRGFADRDGTFYVRVDGVAAPAGTPYTVQINRLAGRHVYVAPDGDDAASGSFAEPWKRLGVALGRLVPGDVLILKDGVYTFAVNGQLFGDCTLATRSGTASQPIRVTALTERRAIVRSDGLGATMFLDGCSYWTIEGLYLANQDNAAATSTEQGSALHINMSSNVTVRRLVLSHNNRYINAHLLAASASSNLLIEEVELYDFHRYGVLVFGSQNVVVRRTFAASRGRADIAGGLASMPSDRGDGGISISHSQNVVVENAIEEGNGALTVFGVMDVDSVDVRLFGVATLRNEYGVVSSMDVTGTHDNIRTQLENAVVVDSTIAGFYTRSNMDFSCTGCTALRTTGPGYLADQLASQPRSSSASCSSCLMVDNTTVGFKVSAQTDGWSITSSNSFGNGIAYDPATAPEIVAPLEIDPKLAGCAVYLPSGSPMTSAGFGGTAIGAQIVFRYRDGELTKRPLWSPESGEFPCGATVPGINDDPATACSGVHTRLHVGTSDCPLPYPPL